MLESSPHGFQYAGLHCGIKPQLPDLAVITSAAPCVAVGVYTQNLVRAACIDWNRSITPTDNIRGIVINSGNANACTGQQGERDNRQMASWVARELQAKTKATVLPEQILVLSTGVIGRHLPLEKVESGIGRAIAEQTDSLDAFYRAAEAIRTTDHSRKTVVRHWQHQGKTYRLAGMAKGAGMIGPNMATMLCVLTTDFPLTTERADQAIRLAARQSFNCISVEGHTSTNDSLILLAPASDAAGQSDSALPQFQELLNDVCLELALKIPTDGEGATHLIHIRIRGAQTDTDADRIARTIALSNLVKTAVSGGDPNWGRVVSAAGYAGVPIQVDQMKLEINGILLFERGQPVPFEPAMVSRSIRQTPTTSIELAVGVGAGAAQHWTSDLTADYVKLNADYTT